MLGMFKKKRSPNKAADGRTHEVLARAASLLDLQLMLCRAECNQYNKFLRSKFVRGYLVGFFDAALQQAGIDAAEDDQFMLFISIGHTYLMGGDSERAGSFALDSLALQGDSEFDRGQAQGGAEYFDFLSAERRSPQGLMNRFHSSDLGQLKQDRKAEPVAPKASPIREVRGCEIQARIDSVGAASPSRITFALASGRVVSVSSFQHSETYGSLLEGRPTQAINDRIIENKLKAAHVRELDKPFLISPEAVTDNRGGLRLPSLCCAAEITSSSVGGDMDGSFLVVVWFANPFFDEPLAAFVEQSLKDLSWELIARDYEI